MVHRILRSEKYYGMVILQKTYTSSYLSKKIKLNKGELDQYVYKDTHPKVINPNVKKSLKEEMTSSRETTNLGGAFFIHSPSSIARNVRKGYRSMGLGKEGGLLTPCFPHVHTEKQNP